MVLAVPVSLIFFLVNEGSDAMGKMGKISQTCGIRDGTDTRQYSQDKLTCMF